MHIPENDIFLSQTFIPSCFMRRRFSSSLCAIRIQHVSRWKDRHENLISINLRTQNFHSASHSMLQVVRCFYVPYGSQDHATRSCLQPDKPSSNFKNPHFFKPRFNIILHLRLGLEMVPFFRVFRPYACVNVSPF